METHRSQARQLDLYAQGRTEPGPIVTWTQHSAHTEGRAVDVIVDSPIPVAAYQVEMENSAGNVDSDPIIGGSLENANAFLGEAAYAISTSSTQPVDARYNYWSRPCVPQDVYEVQGDGKLRRKPWASGNLLRSFDKCDESRKYHKKWENGKLDSKGNPIGREASVTPSSNGARAEARAD